VPHFSPTDKKSDKVYEPNLKNLGFVPEEFKASGKAACNLPSLVATYDNREVTHHDSRGNEPDEKPKVGVINAENIRYKFTD
jgi:hypothetical protein